MDESPRSEYVLQYAMNQYRHISLLDYNNDYCLYAVDNINRSDDIRRLNVTVIFSRVLIYLGGTSYFHAVKLFSVLDVFRICCIGWIQRIVNTSVSKVGGGIVTALVRWGFQSLYLKYYSYILIYYLIVLWSLHFFAHRHVFSGHKGSGLLYKFFCFIICKLTSQGLNLQSYWIKAMLINLVIQ